VATVHTVRPGDCLTSIASRYGVPDAQTLYDEPANQALKTKRPNPNLLYPGDAVTIPDRPGKVYRFATGAKHRIVIKRSKRTVRIALRPGEDAPFASVPYRLVGDGFEVEDQTTFDGMVVQEVPAELNELTLVVGRARIELRVGHLNPMRDVPDAGVSGAQARLANLGFAPGRIDGALGPRTEHAIRAFQRSKGLDETGRVDDALIDALTSAHGC
jgi:N-acetylmuramoyl-L-alanine amidase